MKKSFLLYNSYSEQFELLTDEQLGKLIRGIFTYTDSGKIPELDSVSKMAFSFMKSQVDRDTLKWEEQKRQRSEAGRKGGIKSGKTRRSKTKQNEAPLQSAKQNEANEAVDVDVNVDVNVNKHTEQFEEFWKLYPKKRDKKKARDKYVRLLKKKDIHEQILEGLKGHLPLWDELEEQFIPYPTTWLNGERWNDEIETKRKPKILY